MYIHHDDRGELEKYLHRYKINNRFIFFIFCNSNLAFTIHVWYSANKLLLSIHWDKCDGVTKKNVPTPRNVCSNIENVYMTNRTGNSIDCRI